MEIDASDLISLKCQLSELIDFDDVQQDTEDHHWLEYWDDTNGTELRADLVKRSKKGGDPRSPPHESLDEVPESPVLV